MAKTVASGSRLMRELSAGRAARRARKALFNANHELKGAFEALEHLRSAAGALTEVLDCATARQAAVAAQAPVLARIQAIVAAHPPLGDAWAMALVDAGLR